MVLQLNNCSQEYVLHCFKLFCYLSQRWVLIEWKKNSKRLLFYFFSFEQQVQNFGEPFFLVIHEGETLAEVKVRIQKKLQVPDEEFAKVLTFCCLGACNYLYGIIRIWYCFISLPWLLYPTEN
jgi:hypothetical protein